MKKNIVRIITETIIWTILLWWVPIFYQILLSIIFVITSEFLFRCRKNKKIKVLLSGNSVEKMETYVRDYKSMKR